MRIRDSFLDDGAKFVDVEKAFCHRFVCIFVGLQCDLQLVDIQRSIAIFVAFLPIFLSTCARGRGTLQE